MFECVRVRSVGAHGCLAMYNEFNTQGPKDRIYVRCLQTYTVCVYVRKHERALE